MSKIRYLKISGFLFAYEKVLDDKGVHCEMHCDGKYGPARIGYFLNGNPRTIEFYERDLISRDEKAGPARIRLYETGKIHSLHFLRNGVYYRSTGPSEIYFHESGNISSIFFKRGRSTFPQEDGLGTESYFDDKQNKRMTSVYFNQVGNIHREGDLPAVICRDITGKILNVEIWKNGQYLRTYRGPNIPQHMMNL